MFCTTSCGWGFTTPPIHTSTTCHRRGRGTCGTCCCCGCRSELVPEVCSCGLEGIVLLSPATYLAAPSNEPTGDHLCTIKEPIEQAAEIQMVPKFSVKQLLISVNAL